MGQIGLSTSTGELAADDAALQTVQAFNILTAAGCDLSHVAKVTVFVIDMDNYSKVNKQYSLFFDKVKRARSVVQVAGLPRGALIYIKCITVIK